MQKILSSTFAPSPGKISNLYPPSGGVGLRVDSAVYPGYTIPPYYDSMIAKIIVHEKKIDLRALMKMQRAPLRARNRWCCD